MTRGHNHGAEASSGPQQVLGQIAAAAPRLLDDALAEWIETLLEPCGEGVWTLGLSDIVNAVPLLRSRPVSLDTVIDVVVRGMLARGLPYDEIERRLLTELPELEDPIRVHMMLRTESESSRRSPPDHLTTRFESLPASFGPQSVGGKPRFELVELIGSGTEGVVYRAFDRQVAADGRPLEVAVKLLHQTDSSVAERVSNEAARAMRLRHPAIAALLDWGLTDEGAYLVYEFVQGPTLRDWYRAGGTPSTRVAARFVRQLAEGVQAAHNAGVVHRDLKPDNVIARPSGDVCITDLGLMEAISSNRAGRPGGSLGFAAPEQLRGGPGGSDNLVDVYALGGVLYWLLTGNYPNGDSVEDAQRRMLREAALPPVDLDSLSASDRTLYRICLKALEPIPNQRYASAALLAEDLHRWEAFEPVLPFDKATARRLYLAARRAPAAAAGAALLVMLLVVLTGAAWRLDVNQQRAKFELEQERQRGELAKKQAQLDGERRRVDDIRALTADLSDTAEQILSHGGDPAWLSMFTALESMTNSGTLNMKGTRAGLIDARIRLVSKILADADAQGRRDTVEMAMWETSQIFWMLCGDHEDEAAKLAPTNTTRLAKLIPADDDWMVLAQALQRVAALRTGAAGPTAAEAGDWLKAHMSRLPDRVQEMARPLIPAT